MESIAGNRAVLAYDHDEDGALDGTQLISAETDPDVQREQDIFIFINGNFAAFLAYLRNLSLRDLEQASKWGADLIVLGSHGRKGLKHFLLGSVSETVARHAICSVEIVRVPL